MPAGNLDRDLALARDAAGAAAGLARLGDDPAAAAALRAGPRDGEEALLEADLPWPRHCGSLRRASRPPRPSPLHVSQVSWRGIWIVVSAPFADSSNEISRS